MLIVGAGLAVCQQLFKYEELNPNKSVFFIEKAGSLRGYFISGNYSKTTSMNELFQNLEKMEYV